MTARERLLAAADELFYAEGVQTVGIDRVIEHAGVAKATLYNTFGSKEKLVRAYLDGRHAATLGSIRTAIECHTDPRARLLAVFDAQAELFARPDFRGCAFVTAAAEAPDGGLIDSAVGDYRAEIRDLFSELARHAGVADPTPLARQLQLLYDGAGLSAQMDGDRQAAAIAKAAAEVLLDAALR
ncbi:MAG TPA: TetR/AcrR family transcriptional regulator [Mycobacterium sp.]|jgi:AcrR family transcriptional regulator|nr:TetR/AcrR family transcriptional regulator [Mycobacterium sp.]